MTGTKKVIDAAYNAIKRRHDNIPQEPLPLDVAEATDNSQRKGESRQKSPRSVRFVQCADCRADRPTGVIRTASGSEVFRDHNKVLHGGARIPCSGSGKVAPEGSIK